jgi:phenylalanyl-tRNA synthetase beta subunit
MLGIADVAEEVARIYGYDRIGTASYTTTMHAVSRSNHIRLHRQVEEYCSKTLGYTQMETYPWTHQRRHESFEFLQKIV